MDGIYQAWQTGLLWVCLCALGAVAALVFLAKVAAPAWDAVRRWWSLPCIQRVIVAVCVVGLSYYGATKQGWHVGYDGGIKAGATANVVTNDTVAIHWQRDTSGGVYVPETATVYIDAIEHGSSNVVNIAQTTVGAWSWTGTVENATNYDYNVWAYYIPPEPVHTNGVWTYKTHFDRNGEYALPLRARVEVNGVAIATPAEKRKDAEKRPYDSEVAYIESTGTQWIDTGVKIDNTCGYKVSYMALNNNDRIILGVKGSGDSRWVLSGSHNPNVNLSWNGSFGVNGLGIKVKQDMQMNYLNDRKRFANGSEATAITQSLSTSAGTYNVCIFAGYWGSATVSLFSAARLYSAQITKGQNIIRDLIPVRIGNVCELYDRVTGTFMERHGDFVLGPDVVPATWVDDEYWNALGVATALLGASRCDNFIPVQPSSTVTFYLGVRPGGTTLRMIQYNGDKARIDTAYANNGSARTVTIPANCYYIRVSCETAKKNEAYIHDNTNGRYLMLNGKVVVE